MKKSVLYILLVVLIMVATHCSTVTVRTDAAQSSTDPAFPREDRVDRLFWGYFPILGDYIVRDCPDGTLQRVSVHANWWETIVTVLTVGIYSPVQVTYLCAKESSPQSLIKESVDIEPILFRGDTLTALWINGLRQAPLDWQWDVWFTNPCTQAIPGVFDHPIIAKQDTLHYLIRSLKNQIDYTIGFLNQSDTSLHISKLSQ